MARAFLFLAGGFLAGVSSSYGLAIRIPDRDPFATARGNAFVATADNPSAIYYNPAGITQLDGQNFKANIHAITIGIDYDGAAASVDLKQELHLIPSLYYTISFDDPKLSVGFGVYSPFGLVMHWPDDAPFRTVGKSSELTYITFNPVVAYKLHETLSIAAGPMINYAQAEATQGVAIRGDDYRFSGDGNSATFNVGVYWKPYEQHAFGATYRSGAAIQFKGHSRLTGLVPPPFPPYQKATVDFEFPQNFTVGYSFRPTEKWNFEVNVDWTDWDAVKSTTIQQIPALPVKLDWSSSFMYEFGVTRYLEHGLHVSGGYIYSENSIPDTSYNPIFPDSEHHFFSAGVGQRIASWSWDLGYQFAWGPTRTVNLPATAPNGSASGQYSFQSHAVAASVGFHF